MSETTVGREPLEIVDILTPKCVNKFGCLPCRAALGLVADCSMTVNFAQEGLNSEYAVIGNCTITRVRGGINVAATAADPTFGINSATSTFSGDDYRYVVVHGKVNTAPSSAQWAVYYGTASLGYAEARRMDAVNISTEFRGVTLSTISAGEEFVAVFDAADSTNYATDWQGETITRLRLDIGNSSDGDIDIYSISICASNLFASKGTECFNNRGSCQDPRGYRSEPDMHRTPDLVYGQDETVLNTAITRNDNFAFAIDLRFKATPSGTIWEQGGTTQGVYLGITGTNLVFRAGDGSVSDGVNVAKISTAYSSIAGLTITLFGEIDFAGDTVSLWWWCPCNRTLTSLGTDTASSGFPANWADTNDGAIGRVEGNVTTGETGGDFNGVIYSVRFYNTSLLDVIGTEVWGRHLYLSHGRQGKPSNDIYTIPALRNVSTVGTRLNAGGENRNYEPLGRRATLDFSSLDFAHSDFQQDDYLTDRAYDPMERSTFWTKWWVREKYGRVGAFVTVYNGYAGQALSAMQSRQYILDHMTRTREEFNFHCRDVLSKTEFAKAQVPVPSTGKLKDDIDELVQTIRLQGDVTEEYTNSGTVRIDEEIMTYNGISYDSVTDATTFSNVFRGTDGSVASSHEVDDLVQICRRYSFARVDDVLEELIIDDAGVPSQLVDMTSITEEYDTLLFAYTLTTLITEPTSVSELIGQISLECCFYLWWDERTQKITMQAIKPLEDVTTLLTEENHLLRDTFELVERPNERLTVIAFYYNPLDWAADLTAPDNFHNLILVINSSASGPDQYGNIPQTRVIYSRFLTTEALANQTSSRLSRRFADMPQNAQFHLDAKDRSLWVGDFVRIQHRSLVKADGTSDTDRRWLVIEAGEIEPGHVVRYVVSDVTLDGTIYVIAANGTAIWDPATYLKGVAYVTDNDGFNSDGSVGTTIG